MLDVAAIGQIIREERKELGMRQDELAAASGVGLRFHVELERGKVTVQMGKVLDVLAALGRDAAGQAESCDNPARTSA